jgi:hypothetical protein
MGAADAAIAVIAAVAAVAATVAAAPLAATAPGTAAFAVAIEDAATLLGATPGVEFAKGIAEAASSAVEASSDELLPIDSSPAFETSAGSPCTSSHMGIAMTWPAPALASSLAVVRWPALRVPPLPSCLPGLAVPPATAGAVVVASALPVVTVNGVDAWVCVCALAASAGVGAAAAAAAVAGAGVAGTGAAAAGLPAVAVAVTAALPSASLAPVVLAAATRDGADVPALADEAAPD